MKPTPSLPRLYWLLNAGARAMSAVKEVLLALVFGTSIWKDALVVAWTVPTLAASYCIELLPPIFTPLWVGGRRPPRLRRLLLALVGVLCAMSLCLLLWPHWIVARVAPGLPTATALLAVRLQRWLALNILLLGGLSLASAWCNASRQFNALPAATIIAGLGVVAAMVVSRGWPIEHRVVAVAAGITIGNALGLLFAAAPILAGSRHASPSPVRAPDPAIGKTAWVSLGVLALAMLVINSVPLADRAAAASLPPGSLSAFDYAQRLVQLVFTLTVLPATTTGFTRLAEIAADSPDREAPFARGIESGLRRLLIGMMPIAVAIAVFASPITRCVLGWGRFNAASLALTAPVVAVKGSALGIDAALYYLLFAIYARRTPRARLGLALVIAAINVPLDFRLVHLYGLTGLAWAHVAAWGGGLAWIALRRHRYLPGFRWTPAFADGLKAGAIALAAALVVRAGFTAIETGASLSPFVFVALTLFALSLSAALAWLVARRLAPEVVAPTNDGGGIKFNAAVLAATAIAGPELRASPMQSPAGMKCAGEASSEYGEDAGSECRRGNHPRFRRRPSDRGQSQTTLMASPPITAIVISHNEEHCIADCVRSLEGLVREIVLVDDFSTDRTVEFAQAAARDWLDPSALRVFLHRFECASRQMNFGMQQASYEWLLLIDCDERVSPALHDEILGRWSPDAPQAGFYFPRRNIVFGRWLRHGGNYPDYNSARLVRRGLADYEDKPVHALLQLHGPVAYFTAPLDHFCYPDLQTYFRKFNRYTSGEAARMAAKGRRYSLPRMLIVSWGHLCIRGLWQRAFLDGVPGLQYLWLGFLYDIVRFWKLREVQTIYANRS